jgi:hypothetical protein
LQGTAGNSRAPITGGEGNSDKEEHKGKTGLGIYTLEGDDLQWCVCQPGETKRPKEFWGKGHLFVTFKRDKKP